MPRSSEPSPDQYLMIIGAMKSGTSALFDLLCQHPALCPSSVKEPEYFSTRQGHGLAVGRYEDLWRFDPDIHAFAMEASTGYTKHPQESGVPGRIADYGLRPRFIYLLRDPVDRIASHVSFAAWGKRRAAVDYLDPHVVDVSRYAMQLDQYTAVFPASSVLLLDHTELQHDPRGTAAAVFAFLGLPEATIEPPAAAKNAARPRASWERRLLRSGRVARLAAAAPGPLKAGLRSASGLGAAERPVMDEATAAQLHAVLAPDVARLRDEWGFAVSSWEF